MTQLAPTITPQAVSTGPDVGSQPMVAASPGAGQEGSPEAGTPIPPPTDPLHQLAVIAGMMAGDKYVTGPNVQQQQNAAPDMSEAGLSQRTMNSYDPNSPDNTSLQTGLLEGGRVPTVQPAQGSDQVLSIARGYFGIPYKYGANGPASYDCSSFVQHVYAQMGITLPRVTYDQVKIGQPVMDSSQLRPGDLLFFWGDGNRRNGHVGIYAGGNTMIDEPHTGSSVGYRSVNWSNVTAMRRVM